MRRRVSPRTTSASTPRFALKYPAVLLYSPRWTRIAALLWHTGLAGATGINVCRIGTRVRAASGAGRSGVGGATLAGNERLSESTYGGGKLARQRKNDIVGRVAFSPLPTVGIEISWAQRCGDAASLLPRYARFTSLSLDLCRLSISLALWVALPPPLLLSLSFSLSATAAIPLTLSLALFFFFSFYFNECPESVGVRVSV